MSLTIKGIEAAKVTIDKKTGKSKNVRLADGNGLFLEVAATSKRWRARYFYEGKEQMLSLGKFPVVSLKEALEKNFLLRQQIDQGINPAEERKKEKAEIFLPLHKLNSNRRFILEHAKHNPILPNQISYHTKTLYQISDG